ncbi:gluconokinase, GntK/IdnK-type [Defluviimonas sp. D31]|uniref:gluconokinase n=1 Tax=Defluviimonas sp. D31 TaxID=3083253 RepID=UPI00296FA76B|nr:gluconokinase, GntK/IdnK-type [Defluviimonas sp. D31]MDW4547944.1 gluconokinase, GntK/IdnK-type [Defluviimonas sp. D31]
MRAAPPPRVVIVMGVAGAGKSTLAAALAATLGARFIEGDAYHPECNIAAMSAGRPLTDDMRQGWLDRLAAEAAGTPGRVVLACSALKRAHRERLRAGIGACRFLHLACDPGVAATRIATRQGHFMAPSLLPSQFAALEPPAPDEADAVTLAAALTPGQLLATALLHVG